MTQLRKHLQGRCPVETFSRSSVQPMRNGIELTLGVARQIRPLRQILPQEPIGVFVGATLPGTMRIGKEHADGESLCQALVLNHLLPSIIGQGSAQRGRHMLELAGKSLSGTQRIGLVEPSQEHQARGPLHKGPDCRAIGGPFDQVAFPVAGNGAGGDVGRAFSNEGHVGNLTSPISSACSRPAGLAGLSQGGQQFAPQGSTWQHVQGDIDGFGREAFPHVLRMLATEASGNLFGRASVEQVGSDIAPQPGTQEFARAASLTRPSRRPSVSGAGPIGIALGRITGRFATYRTGYPNIMAIRRREWP